MGAYWALTDLHRGVSRFAPLITVGILAATADLSEREKRWCADTRLGGIRNDLPFGDFNPPPENAEASVHPDQPVPHAELVRTLGKTALMQNHVKVNFSPRQSYPDPGHIGSRLLNCRRAAAARDLRSPAFATS